MEAYCFPSGFQVTRKDVDAVLLQRLGQRLGSVDEKDTVLKMLKSMVLDRNTLALVTAEELMNDAEMNEMQAFALKLEDGEWSSWKQQLGLAKPVHKPPAPEDKPSFSNAPASAPKAAFPSFNNQPAFPQNPVASSGPSSGFSFGGQGLFQQPNGSQSSAAAQPFDAFRKPEATNPPTSQSSPPPPTFASSLAGFAAGQPAPMQQLAQAPQGPSTSTFGDPGSSKTGLFSFGGGAASQGFMAPQQQTPTFSFDPKPAAAQQLRPSFSAPVHVQQPVQAGSREAETVRHQAEEREPQSLAAESFGDAGHVGEEHQQQQQQQHLDEPEYEESAEMPDGDDTDFADLVEHIILMMYNPKGEDDSDDAVKYSIRIDKVRNFLDASPLATMKNGQVRADKSKLTVLVDAGDGVGFTEEEMRTIEGVLFKKSSMPAAPKTRTKRILGRPKANLNLKYGSIELDLINVSQFDRPPLTNWEELISLQEGRDRAFAMGREGSLVSLEHIVVAINEYGRQCEWNRDDGGNFTVRPIQGATIPASLSGYNIVATAETGSGKTMCFAVAALAAIDPSKPRPQVLIMAHNRPLLDQLCDEVDKLCASLRDKCRVNLSWAFVDNERRGGPALNTEAQIILSTANQLGNKVMDRRLPCGDVKLLIADEVDDIFAQGGGRESADEIIAKVLNRCVEQNPAKERPKVLFFSATIGDDENDPDDVQLRRMIDMCVNHKYIRFRVPRKDVAGMTHLFIKCGSEAEKQAVLPWLLSDMFLAGSAIVFCKTKQGGRVSVESLIYMDNDCRRRKGMGEINGDVGVNLLQGVQEFTAGSDITREQRIEMMKRFRENRARILIATDSVAKGIDVPNVTMVVQMELVKEQGRGGFQWIKTRKKALDQFRHRSGRTARALQKGINIVLLHPNEEDVARDYVRILQILPENVRFISASEGASVREFINDAQN